MNALREGSQPIDGKYRGDIEGNHLAARSLAAAAIGGVRKRMLRPKCFTMLRDHRGKGKRGIDREPFLVRRYRGVPTHPAREGRDDCLEQRRRVLQDMRKQGDKKKGKKEQTLKDITT